MPRHIKPKRKQLIAQARYWEELFDIVVERYSDVAAALGFEIDPMFHAPTAPHDEIVMTADMFSDFYDAYHDKVQLHS